MTGVTRTCRDRSGGVRRISLVRAADVAEVAASDGGVAVGEVILAPGRRFSGYAFVEGSAALREEVSVEAGAALVRHELEFALDPVSAESAAATEELAIVSCRGGVVAVVETAAGEKFLVGYSSKFRAGQPLRLQKVQGRTGTGKSDKSLYTIVLHSTDCSPSMPFTGQMP